MSLLLMFRLSSTSSPSPPHWHGHTLIAFVPFKSSGVFNLSPWLSASCFSTISHVKGEAGPLTPVVQTLFSFVCLITSTSLMRWKTKEKDAPLLKTCSCLSRCRDGEVKIEQKAIRVQTFRFPSLSWEILLLFVSHTFWLFGEIPQDSNYSCPLLPASCLQIAAISVGCKYATLFSSVVGLLSFPYLVLSFLYSDLKAVL